MAGGGGGGVWEDAYDLIYIRTKRFCVKVPFNTDAGRRSSVFVSPFVQSANHVAGEKCMKSYESRARALALHQTSEQGGNVISVPYS